MRQIAGEELHVTLSQKLLSVDSTVKTFEQMGSTDGEGIADAEKRSDGDRPARLDLLPMTSRKTESNHIFLRKALGLPQPFHAFSEGCKELSLIDQACLLSDLRFDHHEQISGRGSHL